VKSLNSAAIKKESNYKNIGIVIKNVNISDDSCTGSLGSDGGGEAKKSL
jgi:hypothetical protein